MAAKTSWWVAVVVALTSLQLAATLDLEERAASSELKILRPRSGDIVVAEDSSYSFNIVWENNTADFNASILLRQGPPDNLQHVATING